MKDIRMQKLEAATEFIKNICPMQPKAGIVLGSGLGNLSSEMEVIREIPYADIPYFPVSTVEGHSGRLVFGMLSGRPVVAMAGRFHYYEGYTPEQVVFPIRVLKLLGVELLLVSNAAGGMNPLFRVGELMIITDHISLFIHNPLAGANIEPLGTRFPDMSEPYSKTYIAKARQITKRLGIEVREGVYAGVTGPTFETRAEYKMLHLLGGDAVGMSTVQEVIAACHMRLPVFAMSVITDLGIREEDNIITHEEVLAAARDAEPKLTAIFREMIAGL